MKIRELSTKSGVSRHMIHYYISQGVLHPPQKINQTMAIYDDSHLKRLRVIKNLKADFKSPLDFISRQLNESGHRRLPAHDAGKPVLNDSQHEQRIIDAAIELFSLKGYYGTSVKDVTSRAGTSTGLFYIYFDSKRDLFNRAVSRGIRNAVEEMEAEVKNEKDFFAKAMMRFETLKRQYEKFSEILTQLRAEAVIEGGEQAKITEAVYIELAQPFIKEIHEASQLGLIRNVDPKLLTFALIGLCDMMLLLNHLDGKYDLGRIMEFMADLVLNGVKSDSGAELNLNGIKKTTGEKVKGISETEDQYLEALRLNDYNQAGAALMLGKTRQAVCNYLRRHPEIKKTIEREKSQKPKTVLQN